MNNFSEQQLCTDCAICECVCVCVYFARVFALRWCLYIHCFSAQSIWYLSSSWGLHRWCVYEALYVCLCMVPEVSRQQHHKHISHTVLIFFINSSRSQIAQIKRTTTKHQRDTEKERSQTIDTAKEAAPHCENSWNNRHTPESPCKKTTVNIIYIFSFDGLCTRKKHFISTLLLEPSKSVVFVSVCVRFSFWWFRLLFVWLVRVSYHLIVIIHQCFAYFLLLNLEVCCLIASCE